MTNDDAQYTSPELADYIESILAGAPCMAPAVLTLHRQSESSMRDQRARDARPVQPAS